MCKEYVLSVTTENQVVALKFFCGIFLHRNGGRRERNRNKDLRNRVDTRYCRKWKKFTKDLVVFCEKLEKRRIFSKIYPCIIRLFGLE